MAKNLWISWILPGLALLLLLGMLYLSSRKELWDRREESAAVAEEEPALPELEERLLPARDLLERPPAQQSSVSLRLVGGEERKAVAGAQVRWLPEWGGTPGERRSDSSGTVRLAAPASYLLAVSADGYASFVGALEIGEKGAELHLHRQGGVRLYFHDESGKPVAGVQAALRAPATGSTAAGQSGEPPIFPLRPEWTAEWRELLERDGPLASRELHSALNRALGPAARKSRRIGPGFPSRSAPLRSDASGWVEWTGVPALPGWRWELLSSQRVEWDPPRPTGVSGSASGLVVEEGRHQPLSGKFEIVPEEWREFRITVYQQTSVHGSFESWTGRSLQEGEVWLMHRYWHDPGVDLGFLENQGEDHFSLDATGRFSFTGTRPGTKLLDAWWREGASDYYFVRREFDLEEGEAKDLGSLRPLPGSSVRVSLPIQDLEGRVLNAAELWPQAPAFHFDLGSRDRAIAVDRDFRPYLPLRPGDQLTLHGLAEGRWALSTFWGLWNNLWSMDAGDAELAEPYGGLFEGYTELEFEVPSTEEVVFPFRVARMAPFRLELRAAQALTPGTRWFGGVHAGGHSMFPLREMGPMRELPFSFNVWMPEGRNYFFARYQPDAPEEPGLYAFVAVEGRVGRETQVRLDLHPGASLRGTVYFPHSSSGRQDWTVALKLKEAAGEPVPDHTGKRRGIFETRADPAGNFELHGLPPHATFFWEYDPDLSIATGAPGSVTELRLIRRVQ